MTPRDEGRYAAVPRTTLEGLDERLSNVERILIRMEAQGTPKWLKVGGWTTMVGAVLGAALKVLLESH